MATEEYELCAELFERLNSRLTDARRSRTLDIKVYEASAGRGGDKTTFTHHVVATDDRANYFEVAWRARGRRVTTTVCADPGFLRRVFPKLDTERVEEAVDRVRTLLR